ncbi:MULTISPECIES: DUF4349 domain-containing protein [Sphingomonas]|uniref:DUF4349 domain-containing protein n=1 Tax=Sphingomonas TaxID=13687 RepID=UPI000DEFCE75|nr:MULTISPECIES: DUF4349 domain-containing protein [Sphingomonas]
MRVMGLAAAALLLAGCSQRANDSSSSVAKDSAGPGATPGVAWKFSYDYLLGNSQIEAVQERHAERCEQLGLARCRITGMQYSVGEDDAVSGSLTVKVDPRIARQFGRMALADVRSADGKLVRSDYEGEDVGSTVAAANNAATDIEAQATDLRKRIDAAKPGSTERAELQRQLSDLIAAAQQQRRSADEGQQQLAATPITFNYDGEGGIPGFRENPIKAGVKALVASFVTMISVVLQAIGFLLPWLLLLGLVILVWRSPPVRVVRRWLWQNVGEDAHLVTKH